jgi:hypothetical protein
LYEIASIHGFENLSRLLKNRECITPEILHIIFFIYDNSIEQFHKEYATILSTTLIENTNNFVLDLSLNEIRVLKKETIELIFKTLKTISHLSKNSSECFLQVEKLELSLMIKMLKTTLLDKRLSALKSIIDVIRNQYGNQEKLQATLTLLEENQILQEIFGVNYHFQLIVKSQELIEILLEKERMSETDLDIIWNVTSKGDLEAKLIILKIFFELSRKINTQTKHRLISKIYSIDKNNLIIEEFKVKILNLLT